MNEPPMFFPYLLLFIGILCIVEAIYSLKKGETYYPMISIYKDKNPKIYWLVVFLWLIAGVPFLIGGILGILSYLYIGS
jgi:hypothetical protein